MCLAFAVIRATNFFFCELRVHWLSGKSTDNEAGLPKCFFSNFSLIFDLLIVLLIMVHLQMMVNINLM